MKQLFRTQSRNGKPGKALAVERVDVTDDEYRASLDSIAEKRTITITGRFVDADEAPPDCKATPCEVCGACSACEDFHFYTGQGCTPEVCPFDKR